MGGSTMKTGTYQEEDKCPLRLCVSSNSNADVAL